MDLDKEELKATRKLNGVDKKSNIEEDIKLINLKEINERFNNGTETIEDIINYCRNYEIHFGSKVTIRVVEKEYFDKLVERIKDLEEENRIFALEGSRVKLKLYIEKNYIPKQKVKDKIEENKDTAKRVAGTYQYADSRDDLEEKKRRVIELRIKAEALEELLEDK